MCDLCFLHNVCAISRLAVIAVFDNKTYILEKKTLKIDMSGIYKLL